ncbi:hypothetical protein IJG93_01810 [Candidatus Saccharibacteria bacterium]|nr:hypothetical protein [Candidatus Saccharibacteria bacterium]
MHGAYWSSESYNSAVRYDLYYSGSGITNDAYARNHGIYIRCVSEEKDVSDLTYMQDMTPSVATFTAASLHHPSKTLCHSEYIKSLIL